MEKQVFESNQEVLFERLIQNLVETDGSGSLLIRFALKVCTVNIDHNVTDVCRVLRECMRHVSLNNFIIVVKLGINSDILYNVFGYTLCSISTLQMISASLGLGPEFVASYWIPFLTSDMFVFCSSLLNNDGPHEGVVETIRGQIDSHETLYSIIKLVLKRHYMRLKIQPGNVEIYEALQNPNTVKLDNNNSNNSNSCNLETIVDETKLLEVLLSLPMSPTIEHDLISWFEKDIIAVIGHSRQQIQIFVLLRVHKLLQCVDNTYTPDTLLDWLKVLNSDFVYNGDVFFYDFGSPCAPPIPESLENVTLLLSRMLNFERKGLLLIDNNTLDELYYAMSEFLGLLLSLNKTGFKINFKKVISYSSIIDFVTCSLAEDLCYKNSPLKPVTYYETLASLLNVSPVSLYVGILKKFEKKSNPPTDLLLEFLSRTDKHDDVLTFIVTNRSIAIWSSPALIGVLQSVETKLEIVQNRLSIDRITEICNRHQITFLNPLNLNTQQVTKACEVILKNREHACKQTLSDTIVLLENLARYHTINITRNNVIYRQLCYLYMFAMKQKEKSASLSLFEQELMDGMLSEFPSTPAFDLFITFLSMTLDVAATKQRTHIIITTNSIGTFFETFSRTLNIVFLFMKIVKPYYNIIQMTQTLHSVKSLNDKFSIFAAPSMIDRTFGRHVWGNAFLSSFKHITQQLMNSQPLNKLLEIGKTLRLTSAECRLLACKTYLLNEQDISVNQLSLFLQCLTPGQLKHIIIEIIRKRLGKPSHNTLVTIVSISYKIVAKEIVFAGAKNNQIDTYLNLSEALSFCIDLLFVLQLWTLPSHDLRRSPSHGFSYNSYNSYNNYYNSNNHQYIHTTGVNNPYCLSTGNYSFFCELILSWGMAEPSNNMMKPPYNTRQSLTGSAKEEKVILTSICEWSCLDNVNRQQYHHASNFLIDLGLKFLHTRWSEQPKLLVSNTESNTTDNNNSNNYNRRYFRKSRRKYRNTAYENFISKLGPALRISNCQIHLLQAYAIQAYDIPCEGIRDDVVNEEMPNPPDFMLWHCLVYDHLNYKQDVVTGLTFLKNNVPLMMQKTAAIYDATTDRTLKSQLHRLYVRLKWCELINLNIKEKDVFLPSIGVTEKSVYNNSPLLKLESDLQKKLIVSSKYDLNICKKFANQFGIFPDELYSLWIPHQITKIDCKTNPKEAAYKIASIFSLVDSNLLHEILAYRVLHRLSPYQYEKLDLVFVYLENSEIKKVAEIGRKLIKILTKYERKTKPTIHEDPYIMDDNDEAKNSSTRLPLTPILAAYDFKEALSFLAQPLNHRREHAWLLLKNELNNTASKLSSKLMTSIAATLEIPQDTVYEKTIFALLETNSSCEACEKHAFNLAQDLIKSAIEGAETVQEQKNNCAKYPFLQKKLRNCVYVQQLENIADAKLAVSLAVYISLKLQNNSICAILSAFWAYYFSGEETAQTSYMLNKPHIVTPYNNNNNNNEKSLVATEQNFRYILLTHILEFAHLPTCNVDTFSDGDGFAFEITNSIIRYVASNNANKVFFADSGGVLRVFPYYVIINNDSYEESTINRGQLKLYDFLSFEEWGVGVNNKTSSYPPRRILEHIQIFLKTVYKLLKVNETMVRSAVLSEIILNNNTPSPNPLALYLLGKESFSIVSSEIEDSTDVINELVFAPPNAAYYGNNNMIDKRTLIRAAQLGGVSSIFGSPKISKSFTLTKKTSLGRQIWAFYVKSAKGKSDNPNEFLNEYDLLTKLLRLIINFNLKDCVLASLTLRELYFVFLSHKFEENKCESGKKTSPMIMMSHNSVIDISECEFFPSALTHFLREGLYYQAVPEMTGCLCTLLVAPYEQLEHTILSMKKSEGNNTTHSGVYHHSYPPPVPPAILWLNQVPSLLVFLCDATNITTIIDALFSCISCLKDTFFHNKIHSAPSKIREICSNFEKRSCSTNNNPIGGYNHHSHGTYNNASLMQSWIYDVLQNYLNVSDNNNSNSPAMQLLTFLLKQAGEIVTLVTSVDVSICTELGGLLIFFAPPKVVRKILNWPGIVDSMDKSMNLINVPLIRILEIAKNLAKFKEFAPFLEGIILSRPDIAIDITLEYTRIWNISNFELHNYLNSNENNQKTLNFHPGFVSFKNHMTKLLKSPRFKIATENFISSLISHLKRQKSPKCFLPAKRARPSPPPLL